jgi:hypothetical protein
MQPPDESGGPKRKARQSAAVLSTHDDQLWNEGTRVSLITDAAPATWDSLTSDEQQILKRVALGDSVVEVARFCGCSQAVVRQTIKRTSGKVQELMDEVGLTDHALIEKYLKPALDASDRRGPAWTARLSALDTALRMRGALAADKQQPTAAVQVQINQAIGQAKADDE